MRVTFKVEGLKEVMAKAKRAGEAGVAAAGVALYAVGNNVVDKSMDKTPVDFGNLRGSHYVTHPVKRGGNVLVEVGVGTTAESYAVEQHENLTFQHKEGEAKFLEKALQEEAPQMPRMIQAFMNQALASGAVPALPTASVPTAPTSGRGAGRGGTQRAGPGQTKPPKVAPKPATLARRAARRAAALDRKLSRRKARERNKKIKRAVKRFGKSSRRAVKRVGKTTFRTGKKAVRSVKRTGKRVSKKVQRAFKRTRRRKKR